MKTKLELLSPAGNLTTFQAVIQAGADAVYFGGSSFGARAYAENFSKEEVLLAIDFAHIHGKKAYMTVNTLLKEEEMEERLYDYLLPFYEQGLDGVIVQDFGVLSFVRCHFPKLSVHASTQMTVTGVLGARFLAAQGVSRVVTARELSLSEIEEIHSKTGVEIECFVHGALCYCYSGQCLFSSLIGGRSGNRGRCAQPCRLPYTCLDKNRKSINKNPVYPLSPKDLCTIDRLPDMAEHGVFSFKIEGRMKQAEYAAGVTSIYRKYMDLYLKYGKDSYQVSPLDQKILFDLGNRSGFTEGYLNQWNGADMLTINMPSHAKGKDGIQREIRENYMENGKKEKIQGSFVMGENAPISLTVRSGNAVVKAEGAFPQKAEKQPLREENIRRKLEKTGDTPFAFVFLDIKAAEGLFVPISEINELRRQALSKLEEELLKPFKRQGGNKGIPVDFSGYAHRAFQGNIHLSVSVEKKEQFYPFLKKYEVHRIYIDSMALKRDNLAEELKDLYQKAKDAGKELYYGFPAIFRRHTAEFYREIITDLKVDGFLVKSYDALQFLLESGIPGEEICLDANMYTWSNRTRESFLKLGLRDTVPLELNRKELRARENQGSEMIVYGYLPMMTSVQCVEKTMGRCKKEPSLYYLKDRKGAYFPVKNNCGECYNVIYNSKPLNLLSVAGELPGLGVTGFRLNFTIEEPGEAEEILSQWCSFIGSGFGENAVLKGADFTYGHYKRGVE